MMWFCPTVNNIHPIPTELSKHYNQVLGAWSNVRDSWFPVHGPGRDGPGTPGQVLCSGMGSVLPLGRGYKVALPVSSNCVWQSPAVC